MRPNILYRGVSDADCCPVGPVFESRRRHGCLQGPLQNGGTLNSRRAASPLLRLVEGGVRYQSDNLAGCLRGTEKTRNHIGMQGRNCRSC
ncbi:hypothetical protein TNCV_2278591 [Trichonephila clavipes]|uniref:Uncharacterized protein n=1 Tax=Trichonephila clavipes TaxID=2585209 RepID=A0A8X6R4Q9_TRICX|nr:hypothetical protein TNCV_2278591 [Trichonephila clavipes]